MTSNFIIKDLRECPEHLDILSQWHHEQWASLNPGQTLSDRMALMQHYFDENLIPSTFVALGNDGSLLGSAAIIHNDMETRPQWAPWLASLFVEPTFRSCGVGAALIEHVVSQYHKHGIQQLYLFTPDQEIFYKRLGWTTLEVSNYRDHNVTIMTRKM